MSKIKEFFKNISPINNRTEMPVILYIIKVIIIFWFVKFGSELIGEGFALALHFACGKNPFKGEMFDYNTITLISYFGYGLMVGIMILYWKLFQKKSIAELGFTKNAGTYFIGVLVGVIILSLSVGSVMLTGTIQYNGVFSNIDYKNIILMLFAFMCQGAMEEVLCRGIVLKLLKEKTGVTIAVGISSALFVIPHLLKKTGESMGIIIFAIINLVLISLVFSFLTIRFNSIWAACGFHSIWNFILYNIFGLNLSGNDEVIAAVFDMRSVGNSILNGGIYGVEASVVTAIILALALGVAFVMLSKKGGTEYGIQ